MPAAGSKLRTYLAAEKPEAEKSTRAGVCSTEGSRKPLSGLGADSGPVKFVQLTLGYKLGLCQQRKLEHATISDSSCNTATTDIYIYIYIRIACMML